MARKSLVGAGGCMVWGVGGEGEDGGRVGIRALSLCIFNTAGRVYEGMLDWICKNEQLS